MILGIGWSELLIVGVVVLIVVGPDKLPQFARSAGRFYGQIRRTADEMRRALVLEADRQDAEKRYDEMLERRKRAEEERKKAAAENPGVTAQTDVLAAPGSSEAAEEALRAAGGGALPGPVADPALEEEEARDIVDIDDIGHVAQESDADFERLTQDPHGPYAAGRSLDDIMTELPPGAPPIPGQVDLGTGEVTLDGAVRSEELPPGVTADEWAELPDHIRELLRQRSRGGVG